MPKKIDHEERKVRILKTALDVFAREGYRDSNLSLIAEQCGLSRPTIYQYFKDKNEIFYYAVKLVTGRMFTRYATVAWDESCGDTIQRIECGESACSSHLSMSHTTSAVNIDERA